MTTDARGRTCTTSDASGRPKSATTSASAPTTGTRSFDRCAHTTTGSSQARKVQPCAPRSGARTTRSFGARSSIPAPCKPEGHERVVPACSPPCPRIEFDASLPSTLSGGFVLPMRSGWNGRPVVSRKNAGSSPAVGAVSEAEVNDAPGCGPGVSGFKSHQTPHGQ